MPARRLSCGVVVTDGARMLLGHATRSPRWDIPKGLANRGETPRQAALRELREETGLIAPAEALTELGHYAYLPGKDLALFGWGPGAMPDPSQLACTTAFTARDGTRLLEFDRFGVFPWEEALGRVGRNMARVLGLVRPLLATLPLPLAGEGRGEGACTTPLTPPLSPRERGERE
jgi:8-oxo-dGTP pyrophosphatase MutT (NUDIX family)